MVERSVRYHDDNIEVTSELYDSHIASKASWFGDVPPFSCLEIDILGICNRDCFFCPKSDRTKFPNLKEYLELEFYTDILVDLQTHNYDGRISFCGLSEPFIHKQLNELVALTKEYLPDCFLDIITNGDFLKVEQVTELYALGLNKINVSMYDGPEQVEGFEKIRAECGLTPSQFTIRERYLSADQDFGMTINNRGGSVNLPEYGIVPLDNSLVRSCYYPFHKVVIDYRGDVMVCPSDWEKSFLVGNLKESSIFDIWKSERFDQLRHDLIRRNRCRKPCTNCNVKGDLYAKHHFDAWVEYYKGAETA